MLSVSSALYVGGGVGFAVKVKGEAVGAGGPLAAVALHPHHTLWVSLGGLISDGSAFAVARAKERMAGGAGGGGDYIAVPAAEPKAAASTAADSKAADDKADEADEAPRSDSGGDGSSDDELVE